MDARLSAHLIATAVASIFVSVVADLGNFGRTHKSFRHLHGRCERPFGMAWQWVVDLGDCLGALLPCLIFGILYQLRLLFCWLSVCFLFCGDLEPWFLFFFLLYASITHRNGEGPKRPLSGTIVYCCFLLRRAIRSISSEDLLICFSPSATIFP